jgi:histidinol-phosphate aminotransferase
MSLVEKITPQYIRDLVPYSSAKRELFNVEVANNSTWLNANESPYRGGLGEQLHPNINRYPDFQADNLVNNYAQYADVDPSQVLVTRGADEGIELLVRTFCSPGQDNIVINPPTYGMYSICADTFNVGTIRVQLDDDYQIDVDKLLAQKDQNVKLVFICSPNNPTGGVISRPKILKVLEAYKDSALVVLDEAYIEFCATASVDDLISQYPNLVVLRTLSKAFALAGIRCGFTLAHKDVIDMMKKVIAPYPIPAPVEAVAEQALSEKGIGQMRQQVSQINLQKQAFIAQLRQYPFIKRVLKTDTNFVLMQVENKDVLLNAMQQQDIYLRDQSKQPSLDNHVRITIGDGSQMQAVLTVLDQLKEG